MKRESPESHEVTIKRVRETQESEDHRDEDGEVVNHVGRDSGKECVYRNSVNNEKTREIDENKDNRARPEDETPENGSKNHLKFDFGKFNAEKTLNWRSREKLLIVKGKFKDSEDDSVLILQKNPFPEDLFQLQKSLSHDKFEIENIMRNDIYGTYSISGMNSINSIKATVICPATEKHIRKYSKPQIHFVSESPLIYNTITYPFISKNQFSTNWVTNIINGTEESHRVLYRAEGNSFLIVMDFKWDGVAKDDLHCLAIGGHDAPRSLRDLRSSHLPLLKDIHNAALSVISEKYAIPSSQLRLFVHYPPSFYHLHVHVTHIHNDSASALVDRAHLLSSVIRNIESSADYYEHAILDVTVQDNDPLYKLYQDNNC